MGYDDNTNTNRSRFAGFNRPLLVLLLLVIVGLGGISLGRYLFKSSQVDNWGPILELASFTENEVRVIIRLEREPDGSIYLSGEFTPNEEGFHLYSKDLPPQGIDGLGRPTRLDLTPQSKMTSKGDLLDNTPAVQQTLGKNVPALPIYPAGAVILRLAVEMPLCDQPQTEDQVSVSYMACSPRGCRKPVLGKIVSVLIPCSKAMRR